MHAVRLDILQPVCRDIRRMHHHATISRDELLRIRQIPECGKIAAPPRSQRGRPRHLNGLQCRKPSTLSHGMHVAGGNFRGLSPGCIALQVSQVDEQGQR